MNQLRFQVRPGSAARLREQEESTLTQQLRGVRAGSAAREAEEHRRAESPLAGTSGFSLRAQGGTITRRDAVHTATPAGYPVLGTNISAGRGATRRSAEAPDHPRFAVSAESALPDTSLDEPPPSAATAPLLRRLRSMFE